MSIDINGLDISQETARLASSYDSTYEMRLGGYAIENDATLPAMAGLGLGAAAVTLEVSEKLINGRFNKLGVLLGVGAIGLLSYGINQFDIGSRTINGSYDIDAAVIGKKIKSAAAKQTPA